MAESIKAVQADPDVVDTALDGGEMALLHMGTRTYFSLNPTGARIWQGLKQGLSLHDVSRRLQEEFDVDAERAERSVARLVDELVRHQLAHRA
jgi:hypothetical protein